MKLDVLESLAKTDLSRDTMAAEGFIIKQFSTLVQHLHSVVIEADFPSVIGDRMRNRLTITLLTVMVNLRTIGHPQLYMLGGLLKTLLSGMEKEARWEIRKNAWASTEIVSFH